MTLTKKNLTICLSISIITIIVGLSIIINDTYLENRKSKTIYSSLILCAIVILLTYKIMRRK